MRATRLVVLSSFDLPGELEGALAAASPGLVVEHASQLPRGEDVWGLAVGPEFGPVDDAALAALPGLQLLAATSTGTDHLDVAAARGRGIAVTHTVDYCTDEVADHTIALVLALLRQTHRHDADVRRGHWRIGTPGPRRVGGATLGLYGFGRIGRAVADRAAGLGMRVLVHDRAMLTSADLAVAEQVTRESLLARSDVLSVHVPLTRATRSLVNGDFLAAMKPGAYLVNVARGGIVDEHALEVALHSRRLAGAALDVLDVEPVRSDHPLLDAPGLILTPHAAWYSAEAYRAPFRQLAEAVSDLRAGRTPRNLLDHPLVAAPS